MMVYIHCTSCFLPSKKVNVMNTVFHPSLSVCMPLTFLIKFQVHFRVISRMRVPNLRITWPNKKTQTTKQSHSGLILCTMFVQTHCLFSQGGGLVFYSSLDLFLELQGNPCLMATLWIVATYRGKNDREAIIRTLITDHLIGVAAYRTRG